MIENKGKINLKIVNWLKFILPVFAVSVASAASVDGQWAAKTEGGVSGVVLELKSEGGRLTGALVQPTGRLEIRNGTVEGDRVTFEMSLSMRGQALRLLYSGVLDGDELRITLRAQGREGEETTVFRRVNPKDPLERFSESPAPEEVVAWLKANAIRLSSLQLDTAQTDLMPLVQRLKDARIVAMGEATHGTREFQQIKLRMFRFLVEKLGFTVFGIEANWPESLTVNAYVNGEDVDPVPGLGFTWWKTGEGVALLRWMREYNGDPAHTRKLKFYGFDMQSPGLAEENVGAYLRRVAPGLVKEASEVFAILGTWGENKEYEDSPAQEVKRPTAVRLEGLLRRFDEREQEWVRMTSREEWTMARQNMVIVKQAEVKLGDQGVEGKAYRDRAMAENVKWILDQEPAGTKVMLWAHNGHVAAAAAPGEEDHLPMGAHLREMFGAGLVSCGFVFGEGSFRAVDMGTNQTSTFTVGRPPKGSVDATLGAVGIPLFAVDVRQAPGWLAGVHYSRQIGGGYSEATPGVWMHRVRAAREWDVLFYVDQTTGSR